MFKFKSVAANDFTGLAESGNNANERSDMGFVKINILDKKNVGCSDHDVKIKRQFVTRILSKYVGSNKCVVRPVKCLEACSSSGITGVIWKQILNNDVIVVINADNLKCVSIIKDNVATNGVDIEILSKDPCSILHEFSFNFIFLDCNTETAFYLDAVFKNISRNGVIVISTKDDPALQLSNPEVAFRRYGSRVVRTCYSHELAVRIVIAAMARSAAKYNKGFTVLCCLKHKNTFTIAVMIQKGPNNADKCLKNVCKLVHCMSCEDRAFHSGSHNLPSSQTTNSVLSSKCRNISHTLQELGPLWNGEIFDKLFIQEMLEGCTVSPDSTLKATLQIILEEAKCPNESSGLEEPTKDAETPPLYYNLHKHQLKTPALKSIAKVVAELRQEGFRASRTHFDKLSVRTNAPLNKIYEIMST